MTARPGDSFVEKGLRESGFAVDHDYEVPDASDGTDPHDSYFVAGNTPVQRDIIAQAVLG